MDFNQSIKEIPLKSIVFKTLGFTYLNPHVYSDTVFFLGNFSKNFSTFEKIKFGVGASLASFLFFFLIGYMAKYFSIYANNEKIWKYINYSIIAFMSILVLYIFFEYNLDFTRHILSTT
jgi:L-lysine exporter family protein LysE/ArgO